MEETMNGGVEQSTCPPVTTTSGSVVVDEPTDIVSVVGTAHKLYCTFTEELARGLQRRPLPPPSPLSSPSDDTSPSTSSATTSVAPCETQRMWLFEQLALRITEYVQRVVEFAKKVPGFLELSQDDQLILIKVLK